MRLTEDALREKPPQNVGESQRADRVAQEDLSADSPVKEGSIAWVSRVLVDAVGDELMLLLLDELHVVVEIGGSGDHSQRAAPLPTDHQSDACVRT